MRRLRRSKGEGGVSQRKNGTWQAYAIVGRKPDGKPKRKYVTGATKEEALAKKRMAEAQYLAGLLEQPQNQPETASAPSPAIATTKNTSSYLLGDWADYWLSKYCHGSVGESTYEWYKTLVRVHIKSSELGQMRLTDIEPDDIQTLLHRKRTIEGRSPSLAHALRSVLHNCMEQARKSGHIEKNPVKETKIPAYAPLKQYIILDAEEKSRLVQTATAAVGDGCSVSAIYVLALFSGMRQGECFGTKADCLDLPNNAIRVWRTVEFTQSTGPFLREYPKSDHSRREVIIDDFTVWILQEHIRRQKIGRRDPLFTNQLGRLYNRNTFRNNQWSKFKRRAALPREMNFHDLRHTHATDLLIAGVQPKIVCERLGHHSVSYTIDTYQHYLPSMQMGIKGKLDNLAGSLLRGARGEENKDTE